MSATDELRRMLDERGVEWKEGSPNKTKWSRDGIEYVAVNAWSRNGGFKKRLILHANVTPEQAIEATLGAGKCRNVLGDGHFGCSVCGCHIRNLPLGSTYMSDGKRWYSTEKRAVNYCPHCGAKVVNNE